jgi:hypothetical protein
MLDNHLKRKIIEFVHAKPRTIQEIAHYLGNNWRTADRYIAKICEEDGTLCTRIFREGSRGALKLVYYQNIEKIASTSFQERLFQQISAGKKKEDFSPIDIYQYVDEDKRDGFFEVMKTEKATRNQKFEELFDKAQKHIYFFSGNLSWVNLTQKNNNFIEILKKTVERGVLIKILCRVDIASIKNIEKVLAINEELGKDLIEIRHCEQPLRCILIDTILSRFKETKTPTMYKSGELDNKTFLFYNIYDNEWNEWLEKVFWNLFSKATFLKKRLTAIESLKELK